MSRAPVVLLLFLAGGCARPTEGPAVQPSGVDAGPLPDASYWMVWAYGTEREPCAGPLCARVQCSIAFDHEVEPARQAFRHANASAPGAPWLVVAFDHFTEGDCPLAYAHAFDATRATARMGAWGHLTLDVLRSGDAFVNGDKVPLGQRATWRYEVDGKEGEFRVENLGAWPHAGLNTAAPSAPSAAPR